MGVPEQLRHARRAYDRRDWLAAYETLSAADPAMLHAEDFVRLSMAALLLGRENDGVMALQRAYQLQVADGEVLAAVRSAFGLAMTLTLAGESSVANGWRARADRLIAEVADDVVERGYLWAHELFTQIHGGDFAGARVSADHVVEYGRRFGDPDLLAMGTCTQGRLAMYSGQVPSGLRLLDEAMVGVAAGELSPMFAGQVYCAMIEACQEISDFGRVAEWTSALDAWCASQPDLVLFTGQCAVHRGQVLRFRGDYAQALTEFEHALQRYRAAESYAAAGLAQAERGDALRIRGDLDGAEEAYAAASELGYEPQPALALLWLARGRQGAAVAAVNRLLAEPRDPVHRSQLLPGAIEVLVAGGEVDTASIAAAELQEIATSFGCAALRAMADYAVASVSVAQGAAAEAIPVLRRAARSWTSLGARYEVARCRALVGQACLLLGDLDSAASELGDARDCFADLGATPAERKVAALLAPADAPDGLTPRELEVLRLVATGLSNPEIAATLVLSEKTVARHLSNIYTKLDVSSRTAAAAYAYEQHLV